MAVATDREYALFIDGESTESSSGELGLETLDACLETKSVIVSTSPKPFNPFGL